MPIGAELLRGAEGVRFRVWAPEAERVDVVLENEDESVRTDRRMTAEGNGYHSLLMPEARAGMHYRYRVGSAERLAPDPASRFQPRGPHGPSRVVDPAAFRWTDASWRGLSGMDGQVLYELHVGTFTREGTWKAACGQLERLASIGITAIEVLPVADFPGEFGWGYDGVDFFAPTRLYGEPDDLRDFIDRAHRIGIGVILDVVYNHVGPDGNYLGCFSPHYASKRHDCEWGQPLNFDEEASGPVREFVIENAAYWIREFHFDGLRIDAANRVQDDSPVHVLTEIVRAAREAAGERSILIIGEMEPQPTRPLLPIEEGGWGFDALWNDDFHHSARVVLTGRREGYCSDHAGAPQEFVSAAKYGFLFQGQYYGWQKRRRGGPTLRFRSSSFVNCLENHDQLANTGDGCRSRHRTHPGRHRAMTALFLLMPGTPMLFQGQEFGTSAPFLYFADHRPDIREDIRRGRREFLRQFPSLASDEMELLLADPFDRATFERCKLDSREGSVELERLHRELLELRREDGAFGGGDRKSVDGAVLGAHAFLLRFMPEEGEDRLMLVNFGPGFPLVHAPEPLLAPPEGERWEVYWSSEDPRYGGLGTPAIETDHGWEIPGEATVVLRPVGRETETTR